MQLDALWTLHSLLALCSVASGNIPVSNEPMAAPRVFISFKGRNLILLSFSLTPPPPPAVVTAVCSGDGTTRHWVWFLLVLSQTLQRKRQITLYDNQGNLTL